MAACSDGSSKSMKAIDLICKMRHENDRILVVICEQANLNCEDIRKMVSDCLEEKGCLQFATIEILTNDGQAPKDLIRQYLFETGDVDVDFVFVGNTGADFNKSKDFYLGRVANEIICHTKLNTVFISE
jgi:hypothetical protein